MELKSKKDKHKTELSDYEDLFKKHYKDLCYYAVGYLHDLDLAQETVQEVFFNLWKNKSNHSNIKKTYLYIATKNNNELKYLNYLKSIKLTGEPTPFDYLRKKELKNIIETTLTKMPKQIRKIFILSRYDGLKYSEIAKQLSISIKTVESNMSKALKMLKQNITSYTNAS